MNTKTSTLANPASFIIVTTPDGKVTEFDCLECAHCGCVMPLANHNRPAQSCSRCTGVVCGERCAKQCVEQERWCENVEKGRDEFFRPTVSSVLWVPAI